MDLKMLVRGLWDRIGGWSLIGLGGIALLLGWQGVADTPLTSEQMPFVVSGGLVGLALVGTGATLLLSSDLRDEWRKLDGIEQVLRQIRDVGLEDGDANRDGVVENGAVPGTEKRRRGQLRRVEP